jgi:flagellar basal body rod protein FlgF
MKWKKRINKIVIEEDGWVSVDMWDDYEGWIEKGLGDINVDVEIMDKRK